MFGLEKGKSKKKAEEFIFDLEKDLNSQAKHKEIILLVERRLQEIKNVLRSGADKGNFDQYGVLLHGYTSLLKVISRVKVKR